MTELLKTADRAGTEEDSSAVQWPAERAAAIEGFRELTKKADERVREATAAAQKTMGATDLNGWSEPGRAA